MLYALIDEGCVARLGRGICQMLGSGTSLAQRLPEGEMPSRNQRNVRSVRERLMNAEEGAIGYIVAWLLGVPASVLFLIFLLRGCD